MLGPCAAPGGGAGFIREVVMLLDGQRTWAGKAAIKPRDYEDLMIAGGSATTLGRNTERAERRPYRYLVCSRTKRHFKTANASAVQELAESKLAGPGAVVGVAVNARRARMVLLT